MKNIFRLVRCYRFLFVAFYLFITTSLLHAKYIQNNGAHSNSDSTFIVSGTVKDNTGIPFNNAEVQAIDHSTGVVVTSAVTDSGGAYSLSVVQGTYDVKAIPPVSNGFTPTILLGQTITAPTIIDFVLVPAGNCTLSGQITDRDGNPVGNQPVELRSFMGMNDTTDVMGNYSFTASPGTYSFSITSYNIGTNPHIPPQFNLYTDNLSLSVNTILNIQLPNVSLSVTVLDPANNPVPGTTLSTELAMTFTTFNAGSVLFHGNIGGNGITDTAGHAVLWMFPTTANIKISPPTGSGFAPMLLDNASIHADTAIIVHLVPTVTLSGQITDRDGNPVGNQPVELRSFMGMNDTTDVMGNYSFTASPGTYSFSITSYNVGTNPHIPPQFNLYTNNLSLSVNTILNIQLPNVSLSVTVLDPANNPVPGTTLSTELAMTFTTFNAGSVLFHGNIGGNGITDTAGHAVLWMFPTTANIKISPPTGSGFAPMLLDNASIHADTAIIVHLVPTVTLSGQITDRDGNPVGNQPVELRSFMGMNDTTDVMGNYSFTASPGTYSFSITSYNVGTNPHIPPQFNLYTNNLSLSVNTILNIQLPNVSLSVTVLDPANNPVPGTTLSTELAMTFTTFNAGSVLFHGNIGGNGITDTAGHAVLWMFPTTANIKISPPTGSGFLPFKVDSAVILSDISMVIHLEHETGVNISDNLPTQFVLLQNYPNPFNPSTNIRYALPKQSKVKLLIYNILGQIIADLVNAEQSAGWNQVEWNAHVPSGIYFYRIEAVSADAPSERFMETKKMIMLK